MSLADRFSLDKAVTALFRDYDEPYARGDFTAMRRATVVESMKAGEMPVWYDETGKPALALQWATTRKITPVLDSFGRVLGQRLPGDLWIERVACRKGEEDKLAFSIWNLPAKRVWLTIWQDSPRLRALARACGFRHVGTRIKVPAGELEGIWFKGEDETVVPLKDRAQDATLTRLALPDCTEAAVALAREMRALPWAKHYSVYNVRESWSALALRGYGDEQFIGKPAEMSVKWKAEHMHWPEMRIADTSLRARMPAAEPLIALVPGVKHRIRLMRLAPGSGELLRHSDLTDRDTGVRDGQLMRIHFPLATNPLVTFTMWNLDGRRLRGHMPVGQAWYLDSRKPHCAINGGLDERLHLVMDVESNEELRTLLDVEAPFDDANDLKREHCYLERHAYQRRSR